ncbi:MAG TPA: hypothetical protein VE777_18860 [Gaiellales bacterium]|nr:hypothetical protein [Gaiellales bacterium]
MPPFFVQLRYPQGDRWVTVAVADSRRVAAAHAGAAFSNARSVDGFHADAVRIVTEQQLERLAGRRAVGEARASMAVRAVGGSDS